MLVLGIESTAHTFGVGIVQDSEPFILANARDTFVPNAGGMKPSDLMKHHAEVSQEVFIKALEQANISLDSLNGVAVSLGPGIGPALRVGGIVARTLALNLNIPLIPVNHGIAHIEIGSLTTKAKDPLILYLSGGNTIITTFYNGKFRVFGETLDIALGNMMDVFVREVGLAPPYIKNGKHVIDICAEKAEKIIQLPYVVKGQDMSFSGLLTASLRATKKYSLPDICYSLRENAFDMLLEATERALALTKKKEIMVVGGVAASVSLREKLRKLGEDWGVELKIVPPEYAGDNGTMIAYTGLLALKHGITIPIEESGVRPRWRIDEVEIPWRN
ncbi:MULTISPECIES: KEOPS complex N(6)-L-threonylcarbamoyladenine synthase Kae1 [Acidianus]|uniref:tRNA N6-adenosine threonylcarbamoyltransferase n=1 Tax=Candidatus Acidianus copahuensis TaxID=1160895 RepID=A0A031LML8_9CREN|nr:MULTISPECIES: KEOPS complex N(6)-L-threonylcarbamoyladenine synthase Kae1 [Acidianus]EZQ03130.1 tRNA threonylcarbamoyladenosine biosynthesis protein [Candidatus Acidianus copahuensis]NON63117.1 N(6)-L-threonylcarbamoyladenine synthase Kae1 [Acidianus sp. RZ1]